MDLCEWSDTTFCSDGSIEEYIQVLWNGCGSREHSTTMECSSEAGHPYLASVHLMQGCGNPDNFKVVNFRLAI